MTKSKEYDAIVIGGGMSGLGAGIRLALGGQKVLILERHNALGGLNGFYSLGGIKYDVGLHALTNFVPKGTKSKPLTKICRQLRIPYDSLQLKEQLKSQILFPENRMEFSNDFELLLSEVKRNFPGELDNFRKLVRQVELANSTSLEGRTFVSARRVLADTLSDEGLIEMLLLPLFYYGSPTPNDIDWRQFVILFQAVYMEGFCRPAGGVRTLIRLLKAKLKELGGEIRVKCGVKALKEKDGRISEVILDSGDALTAKHIFSSIGRLETENLCKENTDYAEDVDYLNFAETITLLKGSPASKNMDYTISFYSDSEKISYQNPEGLFDISSGVVCISENYEGEEEAEHTTLRTTHLANYSAWDKLDSAAYSSAKEKMLLESRGRALNLFGRNDQTAVLAQDAFTPKTVERFTGHIRGSIYGHPEKIRNGQTNYQNLYLCGTDQGFLGIVGALLSGISMANLHGITK